MNDMKLRQLFELSEKLVNADEKTELGSLIDEYTSLFDESAVESNESNDVFVQHIFDNMKSLVSELIDLRAHSTDDIVSKRIAELSDKDKEELQEVNRLIDNNLFSYHFQPIVSAVDGRIYSFEALMRPNSDICKSPLCVLKYAEIMNRLDEIERATFVNVLSEIKNNKSVIGDRYVFINSIPDIKLAASDFDEIKTAMSEYSENIVIEMTEQSEIRDDELFDTKKMYQDMGIKVAIDDYGTGYSNIQNLIRYTPDYVKIDRILISNVQNDQNKQHFVREIVDFCHDNGILALAEGVETFDEMKAVISLGVDLIQGYYTARPSSEIMADIPLAIRQEIRKCRRDYDSGKKQAAYVTSASDRVNLNKITKRGYNHVIIGQNGNGDVRVSHEADLGVPIYIDIVDGFDGNVILDGATLSVTGNNPCINIGENCVVKLTLLGSNRLMKGGIRVPESSKLICGGDGTLSIHIDGGGFYGIGNDCNSRHGVLEFEQGVDIVNNSEIGVCIGSGLGGQINITHGKFDLSATGRKAVGIGSLSGNYHIEVFACDVSITLNADEGVGIGSFDNSSDVSIKHTALKMFLSGRTFVGVGTCNGPTAHVRVDESSFTCNISAEQGAAVASFTGDTVFDVSSACVHIISNGVHTLAVGNPDKDVDIDILNSGFVVRLTTKVDCKSHVRDNWHFKQANSPVSVVVNDFELYRTGAYMS